MEIPGVSLNLQDPLLWLTGIHPRQTGGPLLPGFLLTADEGASGQLNHVSGTRSLDGELSSVVRNYEIKDRNWIVLTEVYRKYK